MKELYESFALHYRKLSKLFLLNAQVFEVPIARVIRAGHYTISEKCVTMKEITVILSWKKYIHILLNGQKISKVTGLKRKISIMCTKNSQPYCTIVHYLLCILVDMPKWLPWHWKWRNLKINFVSVYREAIVKFSSYYYIILWSWLLSWILEIPCDTSLKIHM